MSKRDQEPKKDNMKLDINIKSVEDVVDFAKKFREAKKSSGTFAKNDKEKINVFELFPARLFASLRQGMQIGAEKYGKDNWKQAKGVEDQNRYINACTRHLLSFHNGVLIDEEDGQPHLDKAILNLLMVWNLTNGTVE